MPRLLRASAGTLLAGLLLVGVELGLRAADVAPGEMPSSLSFQEPNPGGVSDRGEARLWSFGFPRAATVRPAGLRILAFGESAVQGDPYSPWVAMGGAIERNLRATLPEPVEVLNLGMPGAGSRQLRAYVDRALDVERPAGVVLYIGNNELHELRALKSASPGYSAREELLRRRLWELRGYRLLAGWLRPPAPVAAPPLRLGDLRTPADADDRALAMRLFAANLDAILRRVREAGVPAVVATVAVNELDWYDREDPAGARLFQEGRQAVLRGELERGRALVRESQSTATRPVRALPEARAITRALATEHGLPLCDVEAALTDRAPRGLVGDELFADGCHPNPDGHAAIGEVLSACLLRAMGRSETLVVDPIRPDPARLDRWTGPREPAVPDDGTAEAAFVRGHQAFLRQDFEGARRLWASAVARGGSAHAAQVNAALAALHAGDLAGARAGLRVAAAAEPDDASLAEMLAALE